MPASCEKAKGKFVETLQILNAWGVILADSSGRGFEMMSRVFRNGLVLGAAVLAAGITTAKTDAALAQVEPVSKESPAPDQPDATGNPADNAAGTDNPGTPDPAKFTAQDIFNLEYATDPQISPDGARVAYVRRTHDVMTDRARANIWVVNSDGTNHRPVASGRENFSNPRWSPDGTKLAFISRADEPEEGTPQIFVKWIDTGDTALVTDLTAAPGDLAWSPDGKNPGLRCRASRGNQTHGQARS